MAVISEDDILRLPDSSDEEQETVTPTQQARQIQSNQHASTAVPSGKRSIPSTATRRSKRRKLEAEPTAATSVHIPDAQKIEEPLSFLSQSSQRSRKSTKTYKLSQHNTWTIPQDVDDSTVENGKVDVNVPEPVTSPDTQRKGNRVMKMLEPVQSSHNSALRSSLQVPLLEEEVDGSVGSTINSKVSLFDENERARRDSSSSLSSTDSVVDYQLDKQQKARLMYDEDRAGVFINDEDDLVPYTHYKCPSCRKNTLKKDLVLPKYMTNPSQLPIAGQTKFCYQHRHRDARLFWAEHHYPDIDWNALSDTKSTTLQPVLKHVTSMINRETPSYYLKQMDDAIKSARGNQTTINKYFKTGLLDVAHNGYYGPQGAKLVAQAVAVDKTLNRVIDRVMKTDKSIRIAGVSRVLVAVVVPEILQQLVVKDMVVDEEEARKILEDSTDVGLLLCGDDDVIRRDKDD